MVSGKCSNNSLLWKNISYIIHGVAYLTISIVVVYLYILETRAYMSTSCTVSLMTACTLVVPIKGILADRKEPRVFEHSPVELDK